MMIHPRKYFANFCTIVSNLICPIFCFFPSCSKPSYVNHDACCFANTAVLRSLVIPKLTNHKNPPVFVDYKSTVKDKNNLRTPFAIIEDTHDKDNKAIVIAIRGTAQPADVLIDTTAFPELIWQNEGKYAPDDEQRLTMKDDKGWECFKGNMIIYSKCIRGMNS